MHKRVNLKKKGLRSHLSIAGIGVFILCILIGFHFFGRQDTARFAALTSPMERASVRVLIGVQRSISALRAYVFLGDPKLRAQQAAVWKNEIHPALSRMKALAAAWPEAVSMQSFEHINSSLHDLAFLQEKIADVAHTAGNKPAQQMFDDDARPLENHIFFEISALIDFEKTQPGGGERRPLVRHMADFQAFFGKAHAALGLHASRGNSFEAEQAAQFLDRAEEHLGKIDKLWPLMFRAQVRETEGFAQVDGLKTDLAAYRRLLDRIQAVRASPQWHVARYWLNQEGIPLAQQIDRDLGTFIEAQFAQVKSETKAMQDREAGLFALTLFGSLFLGILGILIANHGAHSVLKPIAALSLRVKKLSQGQGQAIIPAGEIDELDDLISAFNKMQAKLSQQALVLSEQVETVEKKNWTLQLTKKAMASALQELDEERKNLDRQKRHLEMVIESSPNGMLMMSEAGRIQQVNKGIEDLFGYDRGELLGKPLEMLLPERFRKGHVGFVARFLKKPERRIMGEGLSRKTLYGLKKDGSEVPVEVGLGYIRDNERLMVLAVLYDITTRKAVEDKLVRERLALKKSNLELDSFVYTASHDLRAPLRGINSFAKFIEEDYAHLLDEEGLNYLRRIRNGISRMTRLIDDLLSLSRISRLQNPYEVVEMRELLQSVLERIEYDLEASKVVLQIQENLPAVRCDRIKMTEVFSNLINNAIKFSRDTPGKAVIEVGYIGNDSDHQFFVKDHGIGIDPEYHEKIFEIFHRLHTREEYEGSGAGLSIVKRVIDEHHGRIWLDSALGQGTTFHFTIPKNIEDAASWEKQGQYEEAAEVTLQEDMMHGGKS